MFRWEENHVEDGSYEILVAGDGLSRVAAALASVALWAACFCF